MAEDSGTRWTEGGWAGSVMPDLVGGIVQLRRASETVGAGLAGFRRELDQLRLTLSGMRREAEGRIRDLRQSVASAGQRLAGTLAAARGAKKRREWDAADAFETSQSPDSAAGRPVDARGVDPARDAAPAPPAASALDAILAMMAGKIRIPRVTVPAVRPAGAGRAVPSDVNAVDVGGEPGERRRAVDPYAALEAEVAAGRGRFLEALYGALVGRLKEQLESELRRS